jgi:hypothetical protein
VSIVLGLLSVVVLPVAVLATRYSAAYELLHAAFAIPVGFVLGTAAIALARQARTQARRTLDGTDNLRPALVGQSLGLVGLWLCGAAAIAMGVYELAQYLGES